MSIVSAHFHLSFLPPISRLLSHQVSHRTILLLCTRNYPQTRRQRNFHRRSPPGSIPQGLVRLQSCRYSALIRGSAFTKWGDMAKSISSSVSPGRAFKYKKPFSIFPEVRAPFTRSSKFSAYSGIRSANEKTRRFPHQFVLWRGRCAGNRYPVPWKRGYHSSKMTFYFVYNITICSHASAA